MEPITLSLPKSARAFVEAEIATGRYEDASDFFLALITEARKRKARQRIEAMLQESLDSGEPIEVNAAFWKSLMARVETAKGSRKP
jgi:Arc/MetJ-type ribon-helix-helix transcriptional regulator